MSPLQGTMSGMRRWTGSDITILTREGLIGDGLSTACFILGPRKGMELAGKYGAEVLFVLEDGKIVMSEGMEKTYFQRQ